MDRHKLLQRSCDYCGGSFTTRRATTRLCSPTCSGLANATTSAARRYREKERATARKTCEICGKTFRPSYRKPEREQRTCSRSCGTTLRFRTNPPRTPVVPACLDCGVVLESRRRRRCETCQATLASKRAVEYRVAHRDEYNASRRKQTTHHICQECGADFEDLGRRKRVYCRAACAKRVETRRAHQRAGRYHKRPVAMGKLFEVYGRRCWICEKTIDPARRYPDPQSPSVDHVVARSVGGTDILANLRPAHWICNSRRSTGRPGEQLLLAV